MGIDAPCRSFYATREKKRVEDDGVCDAESGQVGMRDAGEARYFRLSGDFHVIFLNSAFSFDCVSCQHVFIVLGLL